MENKKWKISLKPDAYKNVRFLNVKSLLFFFSFLLFCSAAYAQITVKGQVTDENGEPVIGASIAVKETSNGTITDFDGNFQLTVDENAVLIFSYIGYATKEVPVAGASTLNVVLKENTQLLEELVVIGYGTVRKTDLTGSVTAVRADQINRGAITSAQEMLMGKVPGVFILPGDGGPGSGSTIRVRGGASLNASNDPLIVIDGVPVSNDASPGMANALSLINPNDIESFSVLKDASATAIYGSRASNGVIIITTKKGTGKGLTLAYNSSYSISHNSKRVPTMSPERYRSFMLDTYPAGTTNGDNLRRFMGNANTDWQDLIFRSAFATEHNVSASGNFTGEGIKMPYRVSLGYASENGTLKTANMKTTTGSVNLSPSFLDDHLTFTINAKGIYNDNTYADGGAVNAAAFFDPTQDVHFRNPDGSIDKTIANGWFSWVNAGGSPNFLATVNPMAMLYDHYSTSDAYRFLGNVTADYKFHFLPELRFNLNLGLDRATAKEKNGDNPGSIQALKDGDNPGIGKHHEEKKTRSNKLLELYLAYKKDFEEHRLDAMAGYSWQHFYISNDGIDYLNQTNNVFNDPPKYATENYLLSFFGRVNYSYAGKYMATATLRNDASSRFSKDNRWGLFPSAALAWTLSEEDFLKENNALSNLKLRLGWGKTGQQDLGLDDYPYLARYTLSTNPYTNYYFNGQYYSVLKPLAYDENIKWETTETYNAGIDYGFLKGRINGSLDFYFRKTFDLLNTVSTPMGSNFSNVVTTNVGNMENKGLELNIGAVVIQQKDWDWNVGFNITWQKTKVTKLSMGDDSDYFVEKGGTGIGTGGNVQLLKVGYSPFAFYTYQQVYGADGLPVQNAFVDRNKDGQITSADRYISGKKPAPDVFFGLNSKVNYKNWDLGFNAHASFGNYAFNAYYARNSTSTADFIGQGFLVNLANTVEKSGFKLKNDAGQSFTDMFLEDASFFRMDDITLGYTFSNIAQTKLALRLAFTAQNVFVITNYSGLDPEIPVGTDEAKTIGIDNNIWPRPQIYSIRLGLTF
jgi:iron complex outermembrane receptor protein